MKKESKGCAHLNNVRNWQKELKKLRTIIFTFHSRKTP